MPTRRSASTQTQTDQPQSQSPHADLYAQLAAPFDYEFKDTRGGVQLTYVTGQQVTERLNQVLGPIGWSFNVTQHGINSEADEAWVLGELIVYGHGRDGSTLLVSNGDIDRLVLVKRMQFGSQKLKRRRTDGSILDIGFDFKGAATDSLKKCASLLGVGLYLSAKAGGVPTNYADQLVQDDSGPVCAVCGKEISAVRFADAERTEWSAMQVAERSMKETADSEGGPRKLCFPHLKEFALRQVSVTTNGKEKS